MRFCGFCYVSNGAHKFRKLLSDHRSPDKTNELKSKLRELLASASTTDKSEKRTGNSPPPAASVCSSLDAERASSVASLTFLRDAEYFRHRHHMRLAGL